MNKDCNFFNTARSLVNNFDLFCVSGKGDQLNADIVGNFVSLDNVSFM